MANYIVNFLLPITCWFIIGPCLVCMDKLEEEKSVKIGFTWHYWTLSDKLLYDIAKLLKENELN